VTTTAGTPDGVHTPTLAANPPPLTDAFGALVDKGPNRIPTVYADRLEVVLP
jgi:hypothetical protein